MLNKCAAERTRLRTFVSSSSGCRCGSNMAKQSRDRGGWPLTERQFECIEQYWKRKSAKEIAIELGISYHSVEKHLGQVREKLGAKTTIEAAKMMFGDDEQLAVRPYYEAPELTPALSVGQVTPSSQASYDRTGVTTETAPLNPFGAGMTLFLILAAAVGSILAVAALIAAAEGANQLGRAMFS